MLNKVIIEGIIVNQVILSQFRTTFLKLHNKRSYEYQGKTIETQTFVNVTVSDKLAPQVVERFKKGDLVHIEGFLKPKEIKDVTDAHGYKIYEECIVARSVDAMGAGTETTVGKPLAQKETQTTINAEQRKQPYQVVNAIRKESSVSVESRPIVEQAPLDFSDDYEELPF